MQSGEVDLVLVGCDRVTARGDVCNKIGTYLKALAARDNGVPFYVAMPLSTLDLTRDPAGRALQSRFARAYEYSDCWVEDSRLVVLNARDAEARGARIMTRAKVVSAERGPDLWQVTVERDGGARDVIAAKAIVNAGGPWVEDVVRGSREGDREASRALREAGAALGGAIAFSVNLLDPEAVILGGGAAGLMCAIELNEPKGGYVVLAMLERGFLVNNTSATTIRFLPPLVITGDELTNALGALRDVLAAD
jgi:glycine/D-amino acid oxidase-like deaminating enzyme